MGISTVASYTGAQVFEAIGLDGALIDEYFTGTASRIGGVGLSVLAAEVADAPPAGPRAAADRAGPPRARGRRGVPVAPRGRVPPLQPEDGLQAPARHDGRSATTSSRSTRTAVDDQAEKLGTLRGLLRLRPAPGGPDPDRGGGADLRHHGPLLHRCHVLRVHLGRGARDAGHRHEPDRRPLQHRRGRRGRRPLHARRQRGPAAQRHQAGGLGALRGDERVPGQRGRPADQDLPGRQAGGGRPAGGHQDLPLDRADPEVDAGRRADLAAAAPRHLLHRGHRPADPRPQVVQLRRPGCT